MCTFYTQTHFVAPLWLSCRLLCRYSAIPFTVSRPPPRALGLYRGVRTPRGLRFSAGFLVLQTARTIFLAVRALFSSESRDVYCTAWRELGSPHRGSYPRPFSLLPRASPCERASCNSRSLAPGAAAGTGRTTQRSRIHRGFKILRGREDRRGESRRASTRTAPVRDMIYERASRTSSGGTPMIH